MAVPRKTEVCCRQLYQHSAWAFQRSQNLSKDGFMFVFDWFRWTPPGFAEGSQLDAEAAQFQAN